ncbi:MAG: efflux RND transporter permease subunit [Bacteroidetes bacterium]|nr:efflux RND transporter permease subunit [Bacteroidota bacterium]
MKLSTVSVARPAATIMLMIVTILLGVAGFYRLPTNMLPDITYPMVKVYVYWPGATPEKIENEIAAIIERKMATVDDLDYMESTCEEGVYTLLVNFDYSSDRDIAYQDVLAKMGLVRRDLPRGILEPVVFKADPSQLPVVELLVSDENLSLTQLRTWVDNEFQEEFASVKGSAGTALSGGMSREIRVHLEPLKVLAHGVSLNEVSQRLQEENVDVMGGRIITNRRDYIVRTYGEYRSIAEIEGIRIREGRDGSTVYLRDIAYVEDYHGVQRIRTKYNNREGVRISIFKQAAANAVTVSDLVAKRMQDLREELPPSVQLDIIYDQAEYIRSATRGVLDAMLLAAILVAGVSSFFLSGWRRILALLLSLPVTVLGTFLFMDILGFSINIFTLGGLVVSMTVVLDNSVVMLENITRLQESETGRADAATEGAAQVGKAIVTSTITFLALFVPFLLVPGLTSLLFRELVVTLALIILLSMIVSLTLTPMLMQLLYRGGAVRASAGGYIKIAADASIAAIVKIYTPLLHFSLRHPWFVTAAFFVALLPGWYLLREIGTEVLPRADDGLITVKVLLPAGTEMNVTESVLLRVENVLAQRPYIAGYASLAGGRVWGLVTTESSYEGEVNIQLVPPSDRPMTTDEYVEQLRPAVLSAAMAPGAVIKVFHTKMKGIRQVGQFDIELEILASRSKKMSEIYEQAENLRKVLSSRKYLTGLDISLQLDKPEYQIQIRRQQAADLGFSSADIANSIRVLIEGAVPTRYKEDSYYYPIRVVLDERKVSSVDVLRNLTLKTASGIAIPLDAVAEIQKINGPLRIERKNQDRIIKVTANVAGRSIGDATEDLKSLLENHAFPAGYHLEFGGQSQMLSENMSQMGFILLLALFLGYAVLVVYFEDFLRPLIIVIRIPLSLAGISIALYLTDTPISVTALIGVIVLTGIEINNGVLLLTFIDTLRAEGQDILSAITNASLIRLRPIFITGINSIFGLLPLALTIGDGTEMLKPMAIVVIGGLIIGFLLVFIFIPVTYLLLYRSTSPHPVGT